MSVLRPPRGPRPWSGVWRTAGAGILAVWCVLLPLVGHLPAGATGAHFPLPIVVVGTALLPGLVLTRRRLSDAQVLAALAAAQTAHVACYVLPGACEALAGPGPGPRPPLLEQLTAAGPGPLALSGGHAVTLLLAVRLLGATQALPREVRPLAAAARGLWYALLPLFAPAPAPTGPAGPRAHGAMVFRPAVLVRLRPGRAPPPTSTYRLTA
ncbi:hypothetical protein [Streptomyces sp. NPDC097619]|uniref:hypothetical protein n=1 Tax=Streptomyces sp. NPDC097619 TaxID=3157228 RepID=UPI00331D42B1